ncbi:hypothetical protein Tco_0889901 [Tanacetum coccineum]
MGIMLKTVGGYLELVVGVGVVVPGKVVIMLAGWKEGGRCAFWSGGRPVGMGGWAWLRGDVLRIGIGRSWPAVGGCPDSNNPTWGGVWGGPSEPNTF